MHAFIHTHTERERQGEGEGCRCIAVPCLCNASAAAAAAAACAGDSRITMVVPGTVASIGKIMKQVEKLVYVKDITDITAVPYVARELMLVKVRASNPRLPSSPSPLHPSLLLLSS